MVDMPKFSHDYLSHLKESKKLSTAVVQATELRAFFNYLASLSDIYNTRLLTIDSLTIVDSSVIDDYMMSASVNSRKQKASYLNSFFRYLYRKKLVTYNPFWEYDVPTRVPSQKIYVDKNNFTDTILGIASGLNLSEREASLADKTQLRDIAIICIIYYANLSLSECYATNVSDLVIGDDLSVSLLDVIHVMQEKNYGDPLKLITSWYMNSDNLRMQLYPAFHQPGTLHLQNRDVTLTPLLSSVLLLYLSQYSIQPDGPLFYSLRNTRLAARSIEYMINKHFKRYADKHVTAYALSTSFVSEKGENHE